MSLERPRGSPSACPSVHRQKLLTAITRNVLMIFWWILPNIDRTVFKYSYEKLAINVTQSHQPQQQPPLLPQLPLDQASLTAQIDIGLTKHQTSFRTMNMWHFCSSSSYCSRYVSHCSGGSWQTWMYTNCARTCNIRCNQYGACVNRNNNCQNWARQGYCNSYNYR